MEQKLRILADAAKYDASCASSGSRRSRPEKGIGNTKSIGICHSYTPVGRCVSLLKILLTNYCIYDCTYCVNRVTSDTPRARFTPDEVVQLTLDFYKRNYIEGLFLSSGVIQSADYTMDQLIQVARTLREEHGYGGYIHLKAAPGTSEELLRQAGLWADRVSVNIEMPRQVDLEQFAPGKSHSEITGTMTQIREAITEHRAETRPFLPAGQSTQMIVGASSAPDASILSTAFTLYKKQKLRRVYYSAYSPIPHSDPRLPAARAPLIREHRLYQADWLIRFYGFDASELTTPAEQDLPLDKDPKLAWALRHREQFPVDANSGSREMLLRVPGLGVRSVNKILKLRKIRQIRLDTLKRIGVRLEKVRYFLTTAEHDPGIWHLDSPRLPERIAAQPVQLNLFAETVQGEL